MTNPLVIVEPLAAGHHFAYVSLVAQAAEAAARQVRLHVPRDTNSEATYQEFLQPLVTSGSATCEPLAADAAAVLRATKRALRQGADVVVLDVDRWLPSMLLARLLSGRRGRLHLMVTRPVSQERSAAARARFAVKVLCAHLIMLVSGRDRLAILAVPGTDWSRQWPRETCEVIDPNLVRVVVQDQAAARELTGVPTSGVVLGLIGVLSARKNPQVATAAAARLAELRGEDVTLLVVGPVIDDSVLDEADGVHTVHVPRLVPDAELSAAISSCDVLLCLYGNEGSSGIVTTAQAHGVPVVAAGAVGVVALVKAIGAGVTCELTADGVARAISTVLAGSFAPATSTSTLTPLVTWALSG